LFKKNYAIGCATNTNEVGGHAYAVLGAYEVTLDNGAQVKLVRYFNPLRTEVWKTNPWGDTSPKWTNNVKKQVPFTNGNDGVVFSTIEDFFVKFKVTNWAEIHDDYDVSFIDVAFNYADSSFHYYEINFIYFGDADNDLYIFNDQSNGKLLLGCSSLISISNFSVVSSNGTVYSASSDTVKISKAAPGIYKACFSIKKNQKYVKYFTMTAYSKKGKLNFILPKDNVVIEYQKKQCPNNCNLQGKCNTFIGTCTCYFGVFFFFYKILVILILNLV